MNAPHQVEFRAMQLLETLQRGQPLPQADFYCAHFGSWPVPARKAARQLAAYANAARGRDAFWLIGVAPGEKQSETTSNLRIAGAEMSRFEPWLDMVLPCFEGLTPGVKAFAIPTRTEKDSRAKSVIALAIETGRVPFVLKPKVKDGVPEIPWWDAETGAIEHAGRRELLKLLVPLQDLPLCEVLDAELTFYKNLHAGSASKATYRWTLDGSLYVIPTNETRTVI